MIRSISAVTLATHGMARAVRFYRDLGFDLIAGGEQADFTSFRVGTGYLNLIAAPAERRWSWWGRVIFHVEDVDALHARAIAAGLHPEAPPRDAPWGERYFHLSDPDGHELSFARPLAPANAAARRALPSERERRFLEARPVAHLATADRAGAPHLVPVCFALAGDALYITVDEKPKRGGLLKRLRNIAENPRVAVTADRYDQDWTRLGWVMLRGRAEILAAGAEHDEAQARLAARYPQLRAMAIAALPVIALRIERVTSWGDLEPGGPG
ncbi:MAG TPA: TIGR03668 family PPOX class F420-dependent oxidoreductase [Stellaceae bacterium]|jgi:PPOX class probable F420-dependent enzyme|nr:TIGR03668 family PPOX class F420-dependent oxidoreductase [Stellaceae bacterium]